MSEKIAPSHDVTHTPTDGPSGRQRPLGRISARVRVSTFRADAENDIQTGQTKTAAGDPWRDPRKAPQVVSALRRAGRRDPAADPFKPVARSSFLVWLVVLAGGTAAMLATRDSIDYGQLGGQAMALMGIVTRDGAGAQGEFLAAAKNHPNAYLAEALKWTVFVSGGAALYYLVVYLVAANAMRGGRRIGASVYRKLLVPTGRAIAQSGQRTIEQVRRARHNRHGPGPDAGRINR